MSNFAIGAAGVGLATVDHAMLALTTAIRPQPWFDPHYAIPLAGIILGNVLNTASLALDSLLGWVRRERPAIEARLALGDTYRERDRARWCATRSGAACCRSSTRCRPPASSPCRAS